jgi:hypothetical protein
MWTHIPPTMRGRSTEGQGQQCKDISNTHLCHVCFQSLAHRKTHGQTQCDSMSALKVQAVLKSNWLSLSSSTGPSNSARNEELPMATPVFPECVCSLVPVHSLPVPPGKSGISAALFLWSLSIIIDQCAVFFHLMMLRPKILVNLDFSACLPLWSL